MPAYMDACMNETRMLGPSTHTEEARLEVHHHIRDEGGILVVQPRDLAYGGTLDVEHHLRTESGRHIRQHLLFVKRDPIVLPVQSEPAR